MITPITIEPIGVVHNDFLKPDRVRVEVPKTTIEIFPQYSEAMLRMEEHSHLWIIGWFHEARRDLLRVVPRINLELPEYGVFGLRAYSRPNPIGLTVVKLEGIEGNILSVEGLDFIDGTPIIDIKPFYGQDIVFSPRAPYIRPSQSGMLEQMMFKTALNHHQEECDQLILAVKMCLAAEQIFGQLTAEDLKVYIEGTRCLADSIQGLTRSRLANPDRFTFREDCEKAHSSWENGNLSATITLKNGAGINSLKDQPYQDLFDIKIEHSLK